MNILVNGKQTATGAANLEELVKELSLPAQGVAIAVSGKMIPRADWEATALEEGADLFIIKAACGG